MARRRFRRLVLLRIFVPYCVRRVLLLKALLLALGTGLQPYSSLDILDRVVKSASVPRPRRPWSYHTEFDQDSIPTRYLPNATTQGRRIHEEKHCSIRDLPYLRYPSRICSEKLSNTCRPSIPNQVVYNTTAFMISMMQVVDDNGDAGDSGQSVAKSDEEVELW